MKLTDLNKQEFANIALKETYKIELINIPTIRK